MGLAAQTAPAPPAQSPSQAVVEAAGHIRPPDPGYRFPVGETYVYEVEWRLWTAGTATLRMDAADGEYRVTGTADSTGVASLLYTVEDRFESFFDPRTFCSSRLTKNTHEGFRRRETKLAFDYARKRSLRDVRNLKNNQAVHDEDDIPACVTDVLSGLFYIGSLPLQPGATYTFPLNDGKTEMVRAHVEAREEVKVPAGTYRAVRVQPEATSGVLKERGRVWLWYSEDGTRFPVQMRARMFWGTITFRLARIDKK